MYNIIQGEFAYPFVCIFVINGIDVGIKDLAVIHHDSTFLRVEELEPINGRPRFGKVHKCSCGTIFLIAY